MFFLKKVDFSERDLRMSSCYSKLLMSYFRYTSKFSPKFPANFESFNFILFQIVSLLDQLISLIFFCLFQIPPPPPRPNFDASREKLQKLSEGENVMTKEEFSKMKQELEALVFSQGFCFSFYVTMHRSFLFQ